MAPAEPKLCLVSDSQALAALRPATPENDSAVLGRHPNPETMRFLPVPVIGLVGALAFHAGPVVCLPDSGGHMPRVRHTRNFQY
jgi:hypothetical protein